MVKVIRQGVYYMENRLIKESQAFMTSDKREAAEKNTISYGILSSHAKDMGEVLELKPDAVFLCDRVDVLRTLDFIGLKEFPVSTYLHEGICDGDFVRSAAKKWGGAYIPDHLGAAGAYLTEQRTKSGQLLFASEPVSCGALGAMSLVMQEGDLLRCFTKEQCTQPRGEVLALFLKGKLRKGVGPTDVALAICRALEKTGGYVKGKYLEVFGAGVSSLSMDYRSALDGALGCMGIRSAVWTTDGRTKEYFETYLRGDDFKPLAPVQPAYYGGAIVVDLSGIEPMIGVEGEIMTVREFLEDPAEKYLKDGRVFLSGTAVERGSATYETTAEMAEILQDSKLGGETACSWLQYSKSVTLSLAENGYLGALVRAGVDINEYPNVSHALGQDSGVPWQDTFCLDARTIAATLANGGYLTSALGLEYTKRFKKYKFDPALYESRVADFIGKPQKGTELAYGEDITPLPAFPPLPPDLRLTLAGYGYGEEGDRAVLIDDPDEYAWSDALEDREYGVFAALAKSYPERLRTHLIDWGILPFTYEKFDFKEGDVLHLEKIAELVKAGEERIVVKVAGKRRSKDVVLSLGKLTAEERKILLAGGKNNLVRGK